MNPEGAITSRGPGCPRRTWSLDTVRDRCDEVGECWLWKQSVNSTGYPQASINGKSGQLIRPFVYDVLLGKKRPVKSIVATRCEQRLCCSPACLIWRSRGDVISAQHAAGSRAGTANIAGLRARAIANGMAKLTPAQVSEIKALPRPINRIETGARYGVGATTIGDILNGRTWATKSRVNSVFDLGASR